VVFDAEQVEILISVMHFVLFLLYLMVNRTGREILIIFKPWTE